MVDRNGICHGHDARAVHFPSETAGAARWTLPPGEEKGPSNPAPPQHAGSSPAAAGDDLPASESFSLEERRPAAGAVGVWLALLSAHAAVYWAGEGVRARYGVRS